MGCLVRKIKVHCFSIGYIVSCGIRGLYGVMGFHVLVQSDSKPSSFVEKRIEIFLLNTLVSRMVLSHCHISR